MNAMYRLIVDSRRTGTFKRESVMSRQLSAFEARELNATFKRLHLTDRYIKERQTK